MSEHILDVFALCNNGYPRDPARIKPGAQSYISYLGIQDSTRFIIPGGTYDHINLIFGSIFVDKALRRDLLEPLYKSLDIGSTEGFQEPISGLID